MIQSGRDSMFVIDKTLLKPNIPRTIRFTPILYDWLLKVSEDEELSFNQEQYNKTNLSEEKE